MSPSLHTAICDLLECPYPIIQTGMGWVATPELTAAVSNAGAFGFLAAATIRPEEIDGEIEKVKQLTDRPFGVNFLMDAPGADVIADAIVRHKVKAAGYNRAPDPGLIQGLKDAGVVCVPTCGAPRHAVKAQKLGADIIIVQGGEGGGHTGVVPTSLLVPACVDAVDVPIVAAGGLQDGRGLVAALAFGAAGVAMGTRFVMVKESPVPDTTMDRFFAATFNDILVTSQIDGLPQRVIRNELVAGLEGKTSLGLLLRALRNGLAYRKLSGASVPQLIRSAFALRKREKLSRSQMLMAANAPILAQKAMQQGDPVGGYLPSGTVAGFIEDRPTCAELVRRIMEEAERTLKALQE